ncbi:MAG: DUF3127 domain-containing protein [Bacteroidia bacterium]|jgi:hypothetical protein
MEIKGKILQIWEVKQISEKFSNQDFLIETDGQYPKKVLMQAMKSAQPYLDKLVLGDTGTFSFDAESREYNGKYYTNLKCFKIS